jgi:hypothetical protein
MNENGWSYWISMGMDGNTVELRYGKEKDGMDVNTMTLLVERAELDIVMVDGTAGR